MNKYRTYFLVFSFAAMISFIFISCSGSKIPEEAKINFQSFKRNLNITTPTTALLEKYNKDVPAENTTIIKGEKEFSGFVTGNKSFLDEVIAPEIEKHRDRLEQLPPHEIVNELAIFGFEIFQKYFGKDFYRWGGDILDLDDPQFEGVRHGFKYGLDCSGFTALPYELAVYFNLIDAKSALFSSKGFGLYCKEHSFKDTGGREGTSNNFRLDTEEMALLGKEVFRVEKGSSASDEQIRLLQPGDIVGRSGHFGIVVFIYDKPYYLESGGWVVPAAGGLPVEAKTAIEVFAKNGYVSVKRCLEFNK